MKYITALLLNEIYHHMKFQVNSFYTFGEMAQTKIKSENQEREKTQKIRNAEYRFLSTALLLNL
jgi:hypothetical protein